MLLKIKKPKHPIFVYLLSFYFVSLIFGAMNLGRFGSLLRIIAFLPVLWWGLTNLRITLNRLTLGALLFLGFSSISFAWSISFTQSLLLVVAPLSLLLLLFAVSGYRYTEKDLQFLKSALVWSTRVTAVVLLIFQNQIDARMALKGNGIFAENANYLPSYLLFGIVFAVEQILTPGQKQKVWRVAELGFYMVLIFATGSRGGLLAVLAAVTVCFWERMLKNRFSLKSMFLPLLLLGAGGIVILFLPQLLPASVLERFTAQSIVESRGTGRYDLWQNYLQLFASSDFWRQLLGYGYGMAWELANQTRMVNANVTHNIFIEYLISLGIVGLGLFLMYIWQFLRFAFKKREIFALSVLLGMLTLMQFTSFSGKAYWNILIYLVCVSKLIFTPKDSAQ